MGIKVGRSFEPPIDEMVSMACRGSKEKILTYKTGEQKGERSGWSVFSGPSRVGWYPWRLAVVAPSRNETIPRNEVILAWKITK